MQPGVSIFGCSDLIIFFLQHGLLNFNSMSMYNIVSYFDSYWCQSWNLWMSVCRYLMMHCVYLSVNQSIHLTKYKTNPTLYQRKNTNLMFDFKCFLKYLMFTNTSFICNIYIYIYIRCNLSLWWKAEFSASLLKSSGSIWSFRNHSNMLILRQWVIYIYIYIYAIIKPN